MNKMGNIFTLQQLNEMEEMKLYSINGFALLISAMDIIPMLQIVSLVLAIIYTAINIYKKMK